MAVKDDTRQRSLFANDEKPIGAVLCCSICRQWKTEGELYREPRKKKEPRFCSECRSCGGMRKRQKRITEKQYSTEKQRKTQISDRKTPWQVAAEKQRRLMLYRTDVSLSSGWERKAETVVSGNRHRVFSASKKKDRQRVTSWNKAATIQFKAVNLRVKQYALTGWDRKCASAATGQQKRLRQSRNA